MSSIFRLPVGSHLAAIALGAFAATAYLSVNSPGPQSLADYISAICAKSFRSGSRGSVSRRERQRDDKDDDRHGYQAVRRC